MGDDRASATTEPAAPADALAEAGYPPLQSVPPRPQLSYTVQQQRQIVEALIADRENARYTSQVVRHRSGLSSLPPPPTPPEPAAPMTVEPAIASRDGIRPERRLADQETLVEFLGALLFDEPATVPDAALPDPPDRASEPEELSSATPEALPDLLDGDAPEPTATAGATEPTADAKVGQAPLPPARSAVAARLAAGPDVIDALVDQSVPQTPLPPGQSALAARLAAAEQIDAPAPAPLPAPRPAMVRSADAAVPAPPPVKPLVPVSSSMPPRPAEKPADPRSAAIDSVPLATAFLILAQAAA
jgi:hypothetical protein